MKIEDFLPDGHAIGFDVSKEKTAAALRTLADRIETGFTNEEVGATLLQEVTIIEKANFEDFSMTTLQIRFAQRRFPKKPA